MAYNLTIQPQPCSPLTDDGTLRQLSMTYKVTINDDGSLGAAPLVYDRLLNTLKLPPPAGVNLRIGFPIVGEGRTYYVYDYRLDLWQSDTSRDFKLTMSLEAEGDRSHVNYGFFQVQELRNYDKDGNLTEVPYHLTLPDVNIVPGFNLQSYRYLTPKHIADLKVQRAIPVIEVTQYMDLSTVSPDYIAQWLGCGQVLDTTKPVKQWQWVKTVPAFMMVNQYLYMGFLPRTLLFLGGRMQSRGTKLHRFTGLFNADNRTWDQFGIYLWPNGRRPPDMSRIDKRALDDDNFVGNGVKRFHEYIEADFATTFKGLKPPFLLSE